MQIRVPIYRIGCLAGLGLICLALAGCFATVKRYQADGKTLLSETKVPLGMQYDVKTDTLQGDPKAVEAMGAAASKVIDVAGDEVAKYALDKAAQANAQANGVKAPP